MSRFGTYLGSGVTVRYNFGTTGKKKNYYAQFLFIYFEQTVVQITFFFHLDVKILNIITLCYIYIYIYIYIQVHLNKLECRGKVHLFQ